MDFVFDHLKAKNNFTNARLAIELATVVSEPESQFTLNVSQSLDDEYTPGVFKVAIISKNCRTIINELY